MKFGAVLKSAIEHMGGVAWKAGSYGPSQSTDDPTNWLIRALSGGKTKAGVMVSEFTAMQFSAVYNAVGLIADSLAQLPLGVYQKTSNGTKEVLTHPLSDALSLKPNAYQSSFNWRQTYMHHTLLWGNGYSEIERNNAGQAIGCWPLLPDRTYPMWSTTAAPQSSLVYMTTIGGSHFELDPNNVMHVKAIGFDGYIGYSPLTICRQAIGLGLAMEQFGAQFFANDAKSGGFLMHPGKVGTEGEKNLTKSMGADGQGGLDNAHRIKVLEEGMKFIPTTIPPEDAQFLGSRSFQVEEIARIYRVPLVLMNSHERTSALGSSVEQLLLAFVLWTLQPWLEASEQEMNWKLFTVAERAKGLGIRFNLAALMRGDMATRSKYLQTLWQCAAISSNEIRKSEGYNTVPMLDKFFAPANFGQVTDTPVMAAPAVATAPPAQVQNDPANELQDDVS
jgi:HK97 family phage portal protein